jgi:pilus assembly protein Flp/PilA
MQLVASFLSDERGTTAIEYSVLGVLLSLAIVAGARLIGSSLVTMFQPAANNLG